MYYYGRESFAVDARYVEPWKDQPKRSRLWKFELAGAKVRMPVVQKFEIAKTSGIITQQAVGIIKRRQNDVLC